jgi:hypothetical protein
VNADEIFRKRIQIISLSNSGSATIVSKCCLHIREGSGRVER